MELTELGNELLEQRPPMFKNDPTIRAITDVHAREAERIQDAIDEVIANLVPSSANRFLKYWEWLFQLPVEPVDVSVETRRTTVLAYLRRIKDAATGSFWQDRVTDLIGTNWIYGLSNPDNLRGIWWDRYRVQDIVPANWGTTADTMDLRLRRGVDGYDIQGDNTGLFQQEEVTDYMGTIKFKTRTLDSPGAGINMGLTLKYRGSTGSLRVEIYQHGAIRITKNVSPGGTTSLASTTYALAANQIYYMTGQIIGNVVIGKLYDKDPSKGSPTALATVTHTLTSGNATDFGTAKSGLPGMHWNGGDWAVLDTKGAEANWDIADNTIRIITPYTDGSNESSMVENLVRSITPANTDIEVFNHPHFILGVSRLGDQAF